LRLDITASDYLFDIRFRPVDEKTASTSRKFSSGTRDKPDPNRPTKLYLRCHTLIELQTAQKQTCFLLSFFRDNTARRRFLLTLIDAGIIIPRTAPTNSYELLPTPSFVPTGEINPSKQNFIDAAWATLEAKASVLLTTSGVLNPLLRNGIVPGVLSRFQASVQKHQIREDRIGDRVIKRQAVVEWLESLARKDLSLTAAWEAVSPHRRALADSLDEIASAARRPRREKVSPAILELAQKVCETSICFENDDARTFIAGNFQIALAIGRLLSETLPVEKDNKRLGDLMLSSYLRLTQFFAGFQQTTLLTKMIDTVIKDGVMFLNAEIPLLVPFVRECGFDSFRFAGDDLPSLYCDRFPDIWQLWYWIFSGPDCTLAYVSFTIALLVLVIPEIQKRNIESDQALLQEWPSLIATVQLPPALNLAGYIFRKLPELKSRLPT
jgi:hypothetical protein